MTGGVYASSGACQDKSYNSYRYFCGAKIPALGENPRRRRIEENATAGGPHENFRPFVYPRRGGSFRAEPGGHAGYPTRRADERFHRARWSTNHPRAEPSQRLLRRRPASPSAAARPRFPVRRRAWALAGHVAARDPIARCRHDRSDDDPVEPGPGPEDAASDRIGVGRQQPQPRRFGATDPVERLRPGRLGGADRIERGVGHGRKGSGYPHRRPDRRRAQAGPPGGPVTVGVGGDAGRPVVPAVVEAARGNGGVAGPRDTGATERRFGG